MNFIKELFRSKVFRLWTTSIPAILVCTLLQTTLDLGERGQLDSKFLRETVYPLARTITGIMTNIKFRLRGEEHHKQKIVILAADEDSLNHFGRWPWHRDVYAHLIHDTFKLKAKLVGLDIVFSESEDRVPDDLFAKIEKSKLSKDLIEEVRMLNKDQDLADVIRAYRKKLVLGYTPLVTCQPRYEKGEDSCPIEGAPHSTLAGLEPFALPEDIPYPLEDVKKTPLQYIVTAVNNFPLLANEATHAGSFFVNPDPDGYIRRYPLIFISQNKVYPSLALELARLAMGQELHYDFTPDIRLKSIAFGEDQSHVIPSTPLGYLDMNFHAHREDLNYPTVSAYDLLTSVEKGDGKYEELIKDSIVIFGATALGVYDMRAFPFESNSPGVEGHAVALDNILTGDALRTPSSIQLSWLPLALLWFFGLIFAFFFAKLESLASIGIFIGFILGFGFIDMQFLFKNQINFPSAFLLLEVFAIFAFILSVRFILEEQNKKFIKQAFSFYLAPQVVEYVLKDPSKLSIGGERKEISIIFTDIRGFTTLSENMEPKQLSNFLNEYLTAMTEVIFEFGGTLDKYIGDAVMAFWGAPIHNENHAYQGAMAALKMQQRMQEMQVQFKTKYGANLEMGVGLNSGVVSVGNMGSSKIFDYTVIGDHVNLASRLEGLNRLYGTGVLCSQFTIDAIPEKLRATLHYRVLDSVKVKGKKNAIDIVELLPEPLNVESYELFKRAKEEFIKRNWDQALTLFNQSNEVFKKTSKRDDSVCIVFIERTQIFKNNPPPDHWDGSIEMRTK